MSFVKILAVSAAAVASLMPLSAWAQSFTVKDVA